MRKIIQSGVLLFALFFTACEAQNINSSSLTGTWKLVESWGSIGGPEQVKMQIDDKTFLVFSESGELSGSGATGYNRYRLGDSILVFIKPDNSEQNYSLDYDKGRMVLSPAGPNYCIEGCRYVYQKID